ncbi:YlcI/YnfO family protein [Roseovarius tibetensis]|uniref:YlcI/YnfO family protein n=1 Tax=Roseovarius tibetensis TaxID=2685897 RepID=UPI003D7F8A3B
MNDQRNDKGRVPVTVRVPEHILKDIDSCVDNAEVPVSRNHWIVEALIEKLKRSKNGIGADGAQ